MSWVFGLYRSKMCLYDFIIIIVLVFGVVFF